MSAGAHLDDVQRDAVERDADLAWELYGANRRHPKIPRLAQSVLSREPSFTGMIILTALHLQALERFDEARSLLQGLIGQRDRQYLNALRILRDLEYADRRFDESRLLGESVLREDPDAEWIDEMILGTATVYAGDREAGWRRIDDAVDRCGRVDPERYAHALAQRATRFLSTGAPADRFRPAAEEAIAANPSELTLSTVLAFAYFTDYRAAEAETLLRRVLREDPTDTIAQSGMTMVRGILDPIERGDATIDDFRAGGAGEMYWRMIQEQLFDIGLADALAALERVLPRALVRVLRGGLRRRAAEQTEGERTLLSWRDGQDPGTGAAWGLDESFRLLSGAEVDALERAIETDRETYAQWDPEGEYFTLIATDDAGVYWFEGYAGRLYRRSPGEPDLEIAPSLADWMWDRVVAFGGDERRPGRA
ncbi:tetratricopeptide repeat protein [Leucobacter zeae]|nr:tetratricopeptide repeat protein [Leucobacter zeae]